MGNCDCGHPKTCYLNKKGQISIQTAVEIWQQRVEQIHHRQLQHGSINSQSFDDPAAVNQRMMMEGNNYEEGMQPNDQIINERGNQYSANVDYNPFENQKQIDFKMLIGNFLMNAATIAFEMSKICEKKYQKLVQGFMEKIRSKAGTLTQKVRQFIHDVQFQVFYNTKDENYYQLIAEFLKIHLVQQVPLIKAISSLFISAVVQAFFACSDKVFSELVKKFMETIYKKNDSFKEKVKMFFFKAIITAFQTDTKMTNEKFQQFAEKFMVEISPAKIPLKKTSTKFIIDAVTIALEKMEDRDYKKLVNKFKKNVSTVSLKSTISEFILQAETISFEKTDDTDYSNLVSEFLEKAAFNSEAFSQPQYKPEQMEVEEQNENPAENKNQI